MLISSFYPPFQRWKEGNAVSQQLRADPSFAARRTEVGGTLDTLAEEGWGPGEVLGRAGPQEGLHFGIGKLYTELFRASAHGEMALKGGVFFLATAQGCVGAR